MVAACGVDFGTSNSTVGWITKKQQPFLLPLEEKNVTLPSVVFFNAEEDTMCYGRAALTEYLAGYEGRLMRSLKSLLGSSLIDGQTEVAGKALPFRQLLTHFIKELKSRAEHSVQQEFSAAVLGRPVFFVDNNPEADHYAQDTLEKIAYSVGFKEVAFQYEPIAAAFDYESTLSREELVLIVDIGGGTSDFSLVRLSPHFLNKTERKEDILASGGVHIGGTDFDRALSLSQVMPLLGMHSLLKNNLEMPSSYYFNLATWHTINLLYKTSTWHELKDMFNQSAERPKISRLLHLIQERAGHWLALHVEESKIALSETGKTVMHLQKLNIEESLTISQQQFYSSISHLIFKIEETIKGLLLDANVNTQAVDTIFFTGGASKNQFLRDQVMKICPMAKQIEKDVFASIGIGLALDARRKYG